MIRFSLLLAALLLVPTVLQAAPDAVAKADPKKGEPAKANPVRPGRAQPGVPKTDPGKPEPTKLEPGAAVKCTIRSILGQDSAGGVDKRLSFLRAQFHKPPFSAYKSVKLLEAHELLIPQGGSQELNLPNGKVLKLTFKERLLGRKDRLKLRLHLSITPPQQKTFLPGTLFTILNRGTLLVAGDKLKDGTLVVGITCQAK